MTDQKNYDSKKNRSKDIIKVIIISVVTLLISGLIVVVAWANPIYKKAKQLQFMVEYVRRIQGQDIQVKDISNAIDITEQIYLTVTDLRKDLEPILPLCQKLKNVPHYGAYFQMIEPGFDYATYLSKAAIVMGETFVALLEDTSGDTAINSTQALNKFLLENQQSFSNAEYLLHNADTAREKIDLQLIPEKYRDDLKKVDNILEKAPLGFQVLRAVPHIIGTDEAITYLLLVQNRDELRATGGFITAFGLLKLKEGRILALRVEDSTEYFKFNYVKKIRKPPYPLEEIMFANYLVPRDANWSPDFPTAAELTQEMYALSTDIETEGVIAFDQKLIVDLLKFTGPIFLPDLDSTINTDNVEAWMIEYKQASLNKGKGEDRKDFISILAPHLMKKIFQTRKPEELIEFGKLLFGLNQEGHLLLYFNDQDVQSTISQMGIDGSVEPGAGDYLMLVDSNVGFSKVNQYIDKAIHYQVDLKDPKNPHGEIKIHIKHTKNGDEPCIQGQSNADEYPNSEDYYFSRCYWNYWRVYTPIGSNLESASFDPVPEEYFFYEKTWMDEVKIQSGAGRTISMGGLTVVPQKEEKEVLIKTNLSSKALSENEDGGLIYTLRIQKQAGILSLPVEIGVIPPLGYSISTLPDGWENSTDGKSYVWSEDIAKRTDLQLVFDKD